jgi:hypothetical protein
MLDVLQRVVISNLGQWLFWRSLALFCTEYYCIGLFLFFFEAAAITFPSLFS